MKKVMLIGSMVFMAMMMVAVSANAQTRKDKKAAAKAEWEHEQKKKEMARQQELDEIFQSNIPCYEESRSDKEYYRELGEGEDVERNVARFGAVKMAQSMMRERLAHSVKGLSTDYTKMMNKSGKGSDLEQIMEGEFMNVVDAALNDADNPCERWSKDRAGRFHVYYVIEIKKSDIVDKFSDAINNNDKLRAEFDRDQFRKYAEEYMNKQQNFQNGQQ